MDITLLFTILVGLVTLGGAAVAIGKFMSQNQRQLDLMRKELSDVKQQNQSIKTSLSQIPASSTDTYEEIVKISTAGAQAVRADVHSISIPASLEDPTHLRIIYSSDNKNAQIQGMEFPVTKSIAGWVYQYQQPHIKKDMASDERHFEGVDKATGNRTGTMLTLPLSAGGRCHGVIQFIRFSGESFEEEDIAIARRSLTNLPRKLIDLEETPGEDIPTIARGNLVKATILFSDIRAFSEIAKRTSQMVTVSLLNEYYSRTLPLALSRRGVLQEYVGDGLYLSFILDSPSASARAAISSALEMQKEFAGILQGWMDYGHPTSKLNVHCVGIATGYVYSGMMGYTRERHEKLVGNAVNFAAHLCEAVKELGGGILIDQETADLLRSDGYALKPHSFKRYTNENSYFVS
jgi:class 3 adenylate cyclase